MSRRLAETDIDGIAADWVAKEDHGELTVEQARALDTWLEKDPRHVGAYVRAKAIFLHLDRASALGGNFISAPTRKLPSASRRRFLRATGIAGAACVAGYVVQRTPPRHLSTGLGEVRRLPLEDGVAITLNSASQVTIETNQFRQMVRLLDGEVLVDIASHMARPLIVDLGRPVLRGGAGSSFTASRLVATGIEVLVRSGEIAITGAGGSGAPLRICVNHLLAVLPGQVPRVLAINAMEMNRRLSWRDGMLSFDGETLADAARQFARYSAARLIIDDPRIAGMRVAGLYAATDPAGFAQAVARSLGLRVERQGSAIRLRVASPS